MQESIMNKKIKEDNYQIRQINEENNTQIKNMIENIIHQFDRGGLLKKIYPRELLKNFVSNLKILTLKDMLCLKK